ncbi:hypothetical protein SDC9_67130 [bioreactor metagenome]|uniref:DUF3800 domain-containing protein n=1 Tax=bioreactor metagenome TaxID=1076179 RepID=A0A644Y3H6_9ZZZZ
MDVYNLFLDESGDSNLPSYEDSPYFVASGVLVNDKVRDIIKNEFENFKLKYFGDKKYVFHSNELRSTLHWRWSKKNPNYLIDFSNDLEKLLKRLPFYLFMVTVRKQKAFERSWTKQVEYERVYRSIIGSTIKFLIARDVKGRICSEACNFEQDLEIYKAFFHFISNGISRLSITHKDVKNHLTSLSFVTKKNHDCEEQIADMFGSMGKVGFEIKNGITKIDELDEINKVLYRNLEKRTVVPIATRRDKKALYDSINPFVIFP